jgi:two-component system response regulator YesN
MKILICDDEGIVQESLKFIIEKHYDTNSEIRHAKTGRTAIEVARDFRPDLIFMDIQMPGINGIEAMTEIRKEDKNVLFIVLTAYDKFEYAKKAIDIGVLEYLTKPISKDKVLEVIRLAAKKIGANKTRISNELEIKEKLESVVPVIENGFIYNIILQEGQESPGYSRLLDIEATHGYMVVIECGDELHNGKLANTVGAGVRLQRHMMIFREIIKENFEAIVGTLMGNKVLVCVPTDVTSSEVGNEYDNRVKIIEAMRQMLRKLEQQLDIKFKIGIGSIHTFEKIALSYQEAKTAVSQGVSKVTHIMDLAISEPCETSYPIDVETEMFAAIKQGNEEKTLEKAQIFLTWLANENSELTNAMRLKILEHVMNAETVAAYAGAYFYHFNDRNDYLETILSFNTHEELAAWFVAKITVVCEKVKKKQSEKGDGIIENAKAFIDENFAKDISLNDISREVNISPYYFSKIFKETEGTTYIDYVTKLRIDYAKDKLKNSDCSIKEICKEAGYKDPNYFSRIFKKWVGVTPSEYKDA